MIIRPLILEKIPSQRRTYEPGAGIGTLTLVSLLTISCWLSLRTGGEIICPLLTSLIYSSPAATRTISSRTASLILEIPLSVHSLSDSPVYSSGTRRPSLSLAFATKEASNSANDTVLAAGFSSPTPHNPWPTLPYEAVPISLSTLSIF